ncbi:MAG TPA: hypothetical protein PK385_10600 [Spirochaetota bacterium]|jgi:endogenous inhibitor of DNA gyrase (YacG/DUF329 family)|nr:MAG: MYM-type Zinc finger with FCS sequence motif protein [Spirochaetes bacterium ADurb.Bin133]HOF00402.1 hypothetical protein [Spirochaetota bacterium]HOS32680.1 hypothetical protein [Spirochaetota bacterium]HOS56495.1 hypothetical protein [Spirochaetota bacterium]HPK61793.1 hypothetical protein [Spirochaetota bacterium]
MITIYKRCIYCGNYFELAKDEMDREFCNESCVINYERCQVCGNYFVSNEESSSHPTCSKECKDAINIRQRRK